jgi:hypothetical protein
MVAQVLGQFFEEGVCSGGGTALRREDQGCEPTILAVPNPCPVLSFFLVFILLVDLCRCAALVARREMAPDSYVKECTLCIPPKTHYGEISAWFVAEFGGSVQRAEVALLGR